MNMTFTVHTQSPSKSKKLHDARTRAIQATTQDAGTYYTGGSGSSNETLHKGSTSVKGRARNVPVAAEDSGDGKE